MTGTGYMIALLIVSGGITLLLRAMPFLLFSNMKHTPPVIQYVGRVLAPAAIAILVVYCFGSYFEKRPPLENHCGAAELLSALLVIVLQKLFRNSLVSIIAGTILYMVLIQNAIL